MKQRQRFILLAAVLSAAALTVVAGPAAAGPPASDTGPEAVATAYLKARAQAVGAPDPGAPLAQLVAPGSGLLGRERLVARGAGVHAAKLGHLIDAADTAVTVSDVQVAPDGLSATVAAHVVTTLTWHTRSLARDVEASGVDHVVSLVADDRGWRVTGDDYEDVLVPAYLEAAGASPELALQASRTLEKAASGRIRARIRTTASASSGQKARIRSAAAGRIRNTTGRAYRDTIVYKRDSAVSYADRYCLSYFPAVVRFGADCANFVSQCAFAGRMPTSPGTWDTGWWYNSLDTSSPSDDSYSWSWINVGKQMGFWNGLRTDWVPSINDLGRGDAVYYDWSGDGVWDHVAMVVGVNSAGQKVIDAHTTDHYHMYWKLGSSGARYKFARVRAQWRV